MYELLIILLAAGIAFRVLFQTNQDPDDIPHKVGARMARLWDVAQDGMREKKFLRAEKALLTILKMDEKNAAAYNRLGILYAKQKEYDDAIDCFEIATTIERTASGLHNLGLIYFETEKYDKAAIAFKQALDIEDTLATRHIAYAKTLERMNNASDMIKSLEKAAEIEPNLETLTLLMKGYESQGKDEQADKIRTKLKSYQSAKGRATKARRPSKAVV